MKKLLFLSFLLSSINVFGASLDGSVSITVLQGCSVQQGISQLASLGWKPSSFVMTDVIPDNPGIFSVVDNNYSSQIKALYADPNATQQQFQSLSDSISGSMSSANCIQFNYINSDPSQLRFQTDTLTSYDNRWTDLPGMSCADNKGNGIPDSNSPKIISLDINKAYDAYDHEVMDGQVNNGETVPDGFVAWLESLFDQTASVFAAIPHPNNTAWEAMQVGNPIIYSRTLWEPFDAIRYAVSARNDGYYNGTQRTVVGYMPMAYSNPNLPTYLLPEEQKLGDVLDALRDQFNTFIVVSATHNANGDLSKGIAVGLESMPDPFNKRFVVGQKRITQAPYDSLFPHELTSCGQGIDAVVEFDSVKLPTTPNSTAFLDKQGSSYAVSPVATTFGNIARQYNLNADQLSIISVNSTKMANDTSVRDDCSGWGKFNACAAYDYAACNYKSGVFGDTPNITYEFGKFGTPQVNNVINSNSCAMAAFKEACNLKKGIIFNDPATGWACRNRNNQQLGKTGWFYVFDGVDGSTPVIKYSAWPDGIPH